MLTLVVALSVCHRSHGCWQQPGDLDGGDFEPLGAGFRNASSAEECCALCTAHPSCKFFAFAPKGHTEIGPPHNCWLKSRAGSPMSNAKRVRGGINGTVPPPAPPGPSPSGDACNNSTGSKPAWCNTNLPIAERVAASLAEMTVADKAAQLATYTPGVNPGIPRIGWPSYVKTASCIYFIFSIMVEDTKCTGVHVVPQHGRSDCSCNTVTDHVELTSNSTGVFCFL